MARTICISHIAAFLAAVPLATAQNDGSSVADGSPSTSLPSGTTLSTRSSFTTSTATSSSADGSSATTTDVPLALWGVAESLLSSYYPSTTVTQVASLTWPSAVVIAGTTYSETPSATTSEGPDATDATTSSPPLSSSTASPPSTSTPAPTATSSPAPTKNQPTGLSSEKKLGIALGVSVGSVALIVLTLALCCLHRRKKATGAYFLRRRTPSPATDDIDDLEPWHPSHHRPETSEQPPPAPQWTTEKYPRTSVQEHRPAPPTPPPLSAHPAFARHRSASAASSSSSSASSSTHDHDPERNPFFSSQERLARHELDAESPRHHRNRNRNLNLDRAGDADADNLVAAPRRRSSSASTRNGIGTGNVQDRPPTPFSPMAMLLATSPPSFSSSSPAPAPHQPATAHSGPVSPFRSAEDGDEAEEEEEEDEAADVISPILPPAARNPERSRRGSPMVHYPSWDEISGFDFTGEGRRARRSGEVDEGGDGWGPGWRRRRESVVGRHELA